MVEGHTEEGAFQRMVRVHNAVPRHRAKHAKNSAERLQQSMKGQVERTQHVVLTRVRQFVSHGPPSGFALKKPWLRQDDVPQGDGAKPPSKMVGQEVVFRWSSLTPNGIRTLGSHQPGNPSADEVGRAQPQAVQETALARSGDTQSHRVGGGLIHWGVASQGVSTSSNSPGRQLLSNQLSSGP